MSTLCRLCVSTSWYRESLAGGPKVTSSSSPLVVSSSGSTTAYAPRRSLDHPSPFPRFVAVLEESGAHVVDLADRRLLTAGHCPRSAELFRI